MSSASGSATAATRITISAHNTGRHRRDGSRPSGNNKTTKNNNPNVSTAAATDSHPASRAPGTCGAAATASPHSAYSSANMPAASDNPITLSSQPIALAGRRVAIRQPIPAETATARAPTT